MKPFPTNAKDRKAFVELLGLKDETNEYGCITFIDPPVGLVILMKQPRSHWEFGHKGFEWTVEKLSELGFPPNFNPDNRPTGLRYCTLGRDEWFTNGVRGYGATVGEQLFHAVAELGRLMK